MQVFLSTLATVVATVLGIFVAALAAYSVFLLQTSAQYQDKIAEDKVAIGAQISALQQSWPPNSLSLLPPEFTDEYAKNSNKVGAALLQSSLTDLFMNSGQPTMDTPLRRTIQQTQRHDSWHGQHI